jgi:hypothetical protein
MLILGDVGLQIRLSKGKACSVGLQIRLSKGTIGKAEAVNMKWNSHRPARLDL